MPHYFIIDLNRGMHLIEGGDRSDAIERFNDKAAKTKADVCIEAIPCPHPKKFIAPELPDWMEVYCEPTSSICARCSTPREPECLIITMPATFKHDGKVLI